MYQFLNLIFDKHFFWIYRSSENSTNLLHHQPIDSNASFFNENLKEIIRKNNQYPEKITLYYSPEKYTLIPSSIFLPSKLEDYFILNFGEVHSNEIIHFESIVSLNIVIVYAIPVWLHQLKSQINIFGDIKTTINKEILSLDKVKEQTQVDCILKQGYMDVCVKHQGKLVLSNQYEIHNEDDLVYFLLLVKKKLELPENLFIFLNNVGSTLSNLYIKELIDKIQDFNGTTLNIADSHTYFNSLLCE